MSREVSTDHLQQWALGIMLLSLGGHTCGDDVGLLGTIRVPPLRLGISGDPAFLAPYGRDKEHCTPPE